MIINELLVDKYRVQKALDKEVDHSLPKYAFETHRRIKELSKHHGLSFTYGRPGMVPVEDKAEQSA